MHNAQCTMRDLTHNQCGQTGTTNNNGNAHRKNHKRKNDQTH